MELAVIVGQSALTAIVFGFWQENIYAGSFMFCMFMTVYCLMIMRRR